MAKIANPLQTPETSQSPEIMAICPGVPPQTLHIFHIHLCSTPTLCANTPATPLLQSFHEENEWHSSVTMQFTYLTAKPMCHIIQKPPTLATQKCFSTIPLLTVLALAFTMLICCWFAASIYHLLQFSPVSPSDARQVCESSM